MVGGQYSAKIQARPVASTSTQSKTNDVGMASRPDSWSSCTDRPPRSQFKTCHVPISPRCAFKRRATAGHTTAGFARAALERNLSGSRWNPVVTLSTLPKFSTHCRRRCKSDPLRRSNIDPPVIDSRGLRVAGALTPGFLQGASVSGLRSGIASRRVSVSRPGARSSASPKSATPCPTGSR